MQTIQRLEQIKIYAYKLMKDKLDERLTYHSLTHTFNDVLPAAERIAKLENIAPDKLVLVQTAAVLHDVGFIKQRDQHEEASVQIARKILPEFAYNYDEIRIITSMIHATRIPQSPQTKLARILADADLDVLGRDDFARRNQDLRDELAAYGISMTDEMWFTGQLKFVKSHQYFTAVRDIYAEQKQRNIRYLQECLYLSKNKV